MIRIVQILLCMLHKIFMQRVKSYIIHTISTRHLETKSLNKWCSEPHRQYHGEGSNVGGTSEAPLSVLHGERLATFNPPPPFPLSGQSGVPATDQSTAPLRLLVIASFNGSAG